MATALTNAQIADALEQLGDLYELDGADAHRILAYRRAARTIRESSTSVAALALNGRARELPGIGATLEEKIIDLLEHGEISAAKALRERFPAGVIALTRLPGIGPKRARLLFSELGIDSPEALRSAAAAGRLRALRGFGPKFEANVLAATQEQPLEQPARALLPTALALGDELIAALLEKAPHDAHAQIAGSARRMVESVKDLDLIATATDQAALARAFAALPQIERVAQSGPAGVRASTHTGMNVDLRVGTPAERGNLLQHFTGSAAHNAALRTEAAKRGLHISEHAIAEQSGDRRHIFAHEDEVYAFLGYQPIAPELREDRGELEGARRGGPGLPQLVCEAEIRGDLHCHTVASDGRAEIEEMALAARARGYEYLAITDHSASHGFGNALSAQQLSDQIERIALLNEGDLGIRLLAGSEVNILPDGSLDYDDELLARLDWVIASIHTSFRLSEARMTERLLSAIHHPLVDAIGHPTGRLIEQRPPYALDIEAIIDAAARTGTFLEINANPLRRDLSELHARAAAERGALLVINSDAHSTEMLALIRYGIATARRGWLSAAQVANALPLAQLRSAGKRGRTAR
jgi:DNA polymerase (family 10)